MTKNKIILAAIEEFAEHGYQAATIRKICQRAGVNVAGVNYYFSGKAELYRRALKKIFSDKPVLPDAEDIRTDRDIKVVMKAWLKAFISKSSDEQITSQRLVEKIACHALHNPPELFDEIFDSYLRPDIISLEKILRKCLPLNTPETMIRIRLFSIIGSAIFYFFHYRLVEKVSECDDFMDKHNEQIIEHIATISVAGLSINR